MIGAVDITVLGLIAAYALLIIPLGIILWQKVAILNHVLIAVVRMSVQLLFVGLYLQLIFEANNAWLNILWLLIMIMIADLSILKGCNLKLKPFFFPILAALLTGIAIPLLIFVLLILQRPGLMEAQYVIPIGGMILGNCLRVNILGIKHFYLDIKKHEKAYLFSLSQGAGLYEAITPFIRQSFQTAIGPTLATISTIGLVSLPGMMTGVILSGTNPLVAVKYQIAIMIAIFTGSAITILLGIFMTLKISFTPFGILNKDIFKS